MLALGEILQNRYQITGVLGSGGFSTVYLANDLNLIGTEVAVKTMSLLQVPSEDRTWAIEQFRHEALLLSRLNHPGIVRVSDFFNTGNDHYLVMEYVRAETLADLLARKPGNRLLEKEALDLVTQLAAILEFLHGWKDPISGEPSPIIFRDIKPANIMILPDHRVELIDFGTARFFKPGKASDTQNLGTVGYAAPEQYGQGQTDVRSDVYSLGVLLHELVTGYDPSQTPLNLPDVQTLNPTVSTRVAAAIRKATNLDPARRFSNIPAFCQALGVSGKLPVTPPGPFGFSPRNLVIVAVALLLLACLTVTAFATAPDWMPSPMATQMSGLFGKEDPTKTPSPTATERGKTPHVPDTLTPAASPETKDEPTDPLPADSDGDGLSDGDEINIYNTDPSNRDTDGDNSPDGEEIAMGTDPRRPPTATPTNAPTMVPTSTPTKVPIIEPTIIPTPTLTKVAVAINCPGAFPTRLSVGGRARVINSQVNVRSGPGTQYSINNRLRTGREVTILGGPQCDDGQLWYNIRSDPFTSGDGSTIQVEGWVVEESGSQWFLEPAN